MSCHAIGDGGKLALGLQDLGSLSSPEKERSRFSNPMQTTPSRAAESQAMHPFSLVVTLMASNSNNNAIDTPIIYDLAVVGRGMIGSAAARHAAVLLLGQKAKEEVSVKIALIGPSEDDSTKEVYGAHYDEGRITRKTDPDPIWAELASRSIDRYPDISIGSSCSSFYQECGHLAVSNTGSMVIQNRLDNLERMKLTESSSIELLCDNQQLTERFPYLHFPDGCEGILEPKNAGYISARGLVDAQCQRAQELGVDLINRVVERIRPKDEHFELRCSNGDVTIHAKKVLVATGAFTNYRDLVPAQLDLTPIKTQTVHFLLDKADATRLVSMPSIIFKDTKHWAYMLPPIRYPDGTIRLKLGGGTIMEDDDDDDDHDRRSMHSYQELVDWYNNKGGDAAATQEMTELLHRFVPNLSTTTMQVVVNTCATLHTPTRQAYVGEVLPGWAVATGGNGFAAKSSDELGRLGALCVLDPEAFSQETICGHPVAEVLKPLVVGETTGSTATNDKRH
ncbi:FAD dependent oxidoreductase [Seminavis robusta]|uniref:FAD dependent oxidoreductase n=1 Tax=Seminavis robusta TaxID=568900 RepID=A0A9N8EQS9_9STRA|nr:FAD dependent oxidoreductase [Seminavis robusta]|eukprot:Sro1689_g291320.1 FAD dependent oxidoreductase (508) ;mRNA; r:20615-22138